MRFLLDTNVFLWWITDAPEISQEVRRLLEDGNNEIFFSAASGWEIAIKANLGRLTLPDDLEGFISGHLEGNAFQILPIHMAHALHVRLLPNHHKDPFDRLLVAQARLENLTLLSNDTEIVRYPVKVIW